MPPLKPPRPTQHAAIEVNAARGPHTPPPPPPREKLDSREVTTDTLLTEYKEAAEARRAAEKRAADLELKLAAAESGAKANANGPRFSLGSAQWWVLVIGALAAAVAAAGPPLREWTRPSASSEQIEGLRKSLDAVDAKLVTRDATAAAVAKADAARWTISAAFACSQGFRARGLDCSAAQAFADIQPVPLQPKGAPQWKATASWPPVPIPNE